MRNVLTMFLVMLMGMPHAFAQMSESEAQEKAAAIHRKATSDIIFQESEILALYYQNIQMIAILKDIRTLLEGTLASLEEKGDE